MSKIEDVAEAIARVEYMGDKSMTFDMLSPERRREAIQMFIPEAKAALSVAIPEGSVVVPREAIDELHKLRRISKMFSGIIERKIERVDAAMIKASEEG